ncbi:hypothetical protein RDABS01_030962 [Bienertia sinuspersici]
MSNVWSGITENAKLLNDGMRIAVGNGRRTLFWDHKWAMNETLSSVALGPIPMQSLGATVEEMWEPNQGWRWDLFAHLLPPWALEQIDSYGLKQDDGFGDLLYWGGSSNGNFSIQSALRLMKKNNAIGQDNSKLWRTIWDVKAQQRVKMFLWLVMHDRVLSKANMVKRRIGNDTRCARCNDLEETTMHLLRDCPAARHVWQTVGGPALSPSFYVGSLQAWVYRNLRTRDGIANDMWPSFFAITPWWLRRWRNDHLHGRHDRIPIDVSHFLHGKLMEVKRVLTPAVTQILQSSSVPVTTFVRQAGDGGLIRDHYGKFLYGYAARYGSCNAFRAELRAVEMGMEFARSLGYKRLIIQMDSSACVMALKEVSPYSGDCVHLVNHCRALMHLSDWMVEIIHVYREGIRAADWLANHGVGSEDKVKTWQEPPPNLLQILTDDIRGVALPRQVTT